MFVRGLMCCGFFRIILIGVSPANWLRAPADNEKGDSGTA